MIALRFAWRELRSGARGTTRSLGIVLACLALGVGAIAAVGSLLEGIQSGLATEGRRLLGGDLEVQSGAQPLPDALRALLRARGAALSDIVAMRSMLVVPGPDGVSGERQLVELKAVDGPYPLVGAATLQPPISMAEALAERDGRPGLVAEQVVLDRLGVQPGELAPRLLLGVAMVAVRASLEQWADSLGAGSVLEHLDRALAAVDPGARAIAAGD